jgi:hypothetical protein
MMTNKVMCKSVEIKVMLEMIMNSSHTDTHTHTY